MGGLAFALVAVCSLAGLTDGAAAASSAGAADDDVDTPAPAVPLAAEFEREVELRLTLPADERSAYVAAAQRAVASAGVRIDLAQFVVLVDRNPKVQALLLLWASADRWEVAGAAPVSTGLPGRFEHFETPLGVFDHSIANHDFRAEGTKNEFGICGYGRKGMRVYDYGWVQATRGWGDRTPGVMRLQMHATDPDHLEPRLGTPQSKGCIRIPASLNEFIDRRGVLDADYERELAAGSRSWVLRDDRTPTPWSGRYLVVVDSDRVQRPAWAAPVPTRR